MNELKVFNSAEFGTIRTIEKDGVIWFVGKDVANILGYSKPRNAIATHVDIEDKKDAPIQGDLGGTQSMTIINEIGLYCLILSSKLPTAKRFKRWVTSEILQLKNDSDVVKFIKFLKSLTKEEQIGVYMMIQGAGILKKGDKH